MFNTDIYHGDYLGFRFHNNMGWHSSGKELITSITALKRFENGKSIRLVAEYPGPDPWTGAPLKAPPKKRQSWQVHLWPTYEQAIEIEKELVRRLKLKIDEIKNGKS